MKLLRRSSSALVAAGEEPELNVRVLQVPPPRTELGSDGCYLVEDGDGVIHETGSRSRGEALRQLGGMAVRGLAAPLILLGPDGSPTGDRLA